ncbi:MAG: uroporphyrinogen-III C-methyltransferase, partial [Pseudomonadales bacterium]
TLIEGQSLRLLSLTATTTDDWRLAEVEYLLRLANQRILTSKDGRTALNLLNAADDILVELGDPRLYELREAIANDRAALSLVGQTDLDGVFLQLAALAAQIDKLPLLSVPDFSMRAAAAEPNADAIPVVQGRRQGLAGRFGEIARSTWAELKSLVVIQRSDASVRPLLPPEQQYYLRNNLRLLINQAQLALLDGRQAPYRESLANAVGWLEDYFPMQEAANRAVTATLAELSGLAISAEYPDVSASLLAIKAFIAEQHRLDKSGQNKSGKASAGAKP